MSARLVKEGRAGAVACAVLLAAAMATPARAGVISPVEPGGGSGTVVQVRLSGQDGAGPCELTAGQPATLQEDFIPAESSPLSDFTLAASRPA